jgi:hypothetical protein
MICRSFDIAVAVKQVGFDTEENEMSTMAIIHSSIVMSW